MHVLCPSALFLWLSTVATAVRSVGVCRLSWFTPGRFWLWCMFTAAASAWLDPSWIVAPHYGCSRHRCQMFVSSDVRVAPGSSWWDWCGFWCGLVDCWSFGVKHKTHPPKLTTPTKNTKTPQPQTQKPPPPQSQTKPSQPHNPKTQPTNPTTPHQNHLSTISFSIVGP